MIVLMINYCIYTIILSFQFNPSNISDICHFDDNIQYLLTINGTSSSDQSVPAKVTNSSFSSDICTNGQCTAELDLVASLIDTYQVTVQAVNIFGSSSTSTYPSAVTIGGKTRAIDQALNNRRGCLEFGNHESDHY